MILYQQTNSLPNSTTVAQGYLDVKTEVGKNYFVIEGAIFCKDNN